MSYKQRTRATWRLFKILRAGEWVAIACTGVLILAHSAEALIAGLAALVLDRAARTARSASSRYYRIADDARSAGHIFPRASLRERERVARELRGNREDKD